MGHRPFCWPLAPPGVTALLCWGQAVRVCSRLLLGGSGWLSDDWWAGLLFLFGGRRVIRLRLLRGIHPGGVPHIHEHLGSRGEALLFESSRVGRTAAFEAAILVDF